MHSKTLLATPNFWAFGQLDWVATFASLDHILTMAAMSNYLINKVVEESSRKKKEEEQQLLNHLIELKVMR